MTEAAIFEDRAPAGPDNAEGPCFKQLLGPAAWQRLDPAVRARFARNPAEGEVRSYDGTMGVVRCSKIGRVIAQACRLIGTPLAPFTGQNIPTEVNVYREARGGGVVWARRYRFPGKAPVTVLSAKRIDRNGGLLECVKGGLGMTLRIFEHNGQLHFQSTGYFWQLGPQGWHLRLPLPDLLTPGVALVTHEDQGNGQFRFTLTMTHPVLGETFHQDGLFEAREETK